MNKALRITLTLLALTLLSCTPEPEPIRYGEATCAQCKMMIMDQKFGAEIVTQKGKTYMFDSIECMIGFYQSNSIEKTAIHSLWITPYNEPGKLIDATKAYYLISENLPSPMGKFLSGYETREAAAGLQSERGGQIYSWDELLLLFDNKTGASSGLKPATSCCGNEMAAASY
jgi:copper chaperone NosL